MPSDFISIDLKSGDITCKKSINSNELYNYLYAGNGKIFTTCTKSSNYLENNKLAELDFSDDIFDVREIGK
jgi:hypothetical protein